MARSGLSAPLSTRFMAARRSCSSDRAPAPRGAAAALLGGGTGAAGVTGATGATGAAGRGAGAADATGAAGRYAAAP